MSYIVVPDTRYLTSQPLWIAEQPHVEMKSLMHADYPGHFHVTRREAAYGLRAKSYKPKVSAYRSTLQLRTAYRSTGLMNDPEPAYAIRPEQLLLDPHYQRDRSVDDRQLNQSKWLSRGQLRRSDAPMEPRSLYRLDFSPKTTDPVRRITIEHVPLRSQETFTSTSIYKTDFKRISATGNRNPEYRENTPCPPSGRFSVAKCTDLEPKSDQHSDESHTPRMSTKSSYKIDYQPYAVPSVRVPLLTRRVAPQLFSRPVTNPPFEVTKIDVSQMKSSYQDHYNPELKPDPRNLTPAGSVTRGGRMISQRETYGYYYKASSPRPVTLNSKASPANSTISVHTANSNLHSWKANRNDKNSTVHIFYEQSEPSTRSANTMTTNNPNYDCEVNEALRLYATGLLSGRKTSSQHSVPRHMHRSVVYKATGEYVNDPVCRTGASEESNSAGYLVSSGI
ncbi:hypothetical protein FBUS_01091 [Fasciolopsis buskii]|uniref:Uncharacterized protein n=1 Tax=Fasciolopsis buskii TaxID=27845 RepID=A0A8E0S5W2_9TREM|nr:hypothetical protein FBUS_01091 [Fasciolopsis buski]